MCIPAIAWVNCDFDYGSLASDPIQCSTGEQVDLLALTGCAMQGGSNTSATIVNCPASKNETTSFPITIQDDNSFGGPGCDSVTKTFYVRNTGM